MGRHSAQRRHGPVLVLGAVALVGSAGIAWAVGNSPADSPRPDAVTTLSPVPSATTRVAVPAPTPSGTDTGPRLVEVVPVSTPGVTPTPVGSTSTTSPTPAATASPTPTRTKPGRGVVPTPRPTKTHK